jgi:hypothetical protein
LLARRSCFQKNGPELYFPAGDKESLLTGAAASTIPSCAAVCLWALADNFFRQSSEWFNATATNAGSSRTCHWHVTCQALPAASIEFRKQIEVAFPILAGSMSTMYS